MIPRALLVVPVLALAAAAQPMFEGASILPGHALKGSPKSVRVEREALTGKQSRVPEEEHSFRPDGKLLSSSRFVEGKLVHSRSFAYDVAGKRLKIETRDASGRTTRVRRFQRLENGTEEEMESWAGKETSRSIRRFDDEGRVVELRLIGANGEETDMGFLYDGQGRPVEARVRFAGVREKEDGLRVQFAYTGENQSLLSVYNGSGELMFRAESDEDHAGNEATRVLFETDAQNPPFTSGGVDETDAQGNWTLKTIMQRNQRTQVDEPVARLHRNITYHARAKR